MNQFNCLVGLTIETLEFPEYNEVLILKTTCGREFKMYHKQDCCENVELERIDGELLDLLKGDPILAAYETEEEQEDEADGDGTHTWTFYTIRTMNTTVVLRWLGRSNGYYSETVEFKEITEVDIPFDRVRRLDHETAILNGKEEINIEFACNQLRKMIVGNYNEITLRESPPFVFNKEVGGSDIYNFKALGLLKYLENLPNE